jgi:hypothetical protein
VRRLTEGRRSRPHQPTCRVHLSTPRDHRCGPPVCKRAQHARPRADMISRPEPFAVRYRQEASDRRTDARPAPLASARPTIGVLVETSLNERLIPMMTPLTLSLTPAQSAHEQPCAVCGADFVPAEDSGSRLLSLMPADQEPFGVLMCGGCYSRWSHGVTVTVRRGSESPVAPVLRRPGRG